MAYLEVLAGCNIGTHFALADTVCLGRSAANGLCLPDRAASRHHARITRHESCFVLEDLHSANGTLLRGALISPGVSCPLSDGDEIKIGAICGWLRRSAWCPVGRV